jgi:DNA-binding NarL/FixJ family response regulator
VSRKVAAKMTAWMNEDSPAKEKGLTPREVQVLKKVVAGKTNQEIGLDLGISEKTVEKHLEGVFSKLGVTSRVEAAVHALREGWV